LRNIKTLQGWQNNGRETNTTKNRRSGKTL